MNKIEFVDSIRRNISSIGDYNFVNDTVLYYQDYIDTAIRKGQTEEEVLAELGDPRLIAKSILASHGMAADEETLFEDSSNGNSEEGKKINIQTKGGELISIPVWLAKVGGIVLAIAILVLVGMLAIKLLPVVVVVLLVYYIIRFIKDNF